ncbi:MAG: hemophore-related protein [Chitinophagaceae bacterium]|nr:MAG: hemophore-related protein [Chitinophagaceae bacterium]
MSFTTRMMVGAGSALVAVMASGAVAYAQPDPTPIMYSTCTYPQVIAALNALDPGAAAELQANPIGVGYLHQLIASGPQQRKALITRAYNTPGAAQYTDLVLNVASTCNNF